ncbi:MAG TPA: non-homologous end-joining DNA ligase [Acidimicrobiia bacterium]|jgi:bifunctional non-homologous end joining protein LigD
MLASVADELADSAAWAYEMKWDGIRAIVTWDARDRIQIESRNGNDVSVSFPELASLGDALGQRGAVLDGEIVALDEHARPSFQLLQSRMHVFDPGVAARRAAETPVVLIVFDVLWLNGELTIELPYDDRRGLLGGLGLSGPAWQTPRVGDAGAEASLEASRKLGFEGVVAKRRDSRYEPGRRSQAWRKVKHQLRQELVVVGWQPGKGSRSTTLGSLLLAYREGEDLRYAGKVGTGMSDAELERLAALLTPLEVPRLALRGGGVPRDARLVRPELVVEVAFTGWTDAGRVRHATYLGLRDDKDAADVVREQ